ncbi:Tripartite-type tricarboxylate transporter, receptor component TctC [Roseivivax marinus]|uniref:tripartite tricarboxylate transporter substrate binding protein n=1 Tax=Roseivivax marinus TaxID=1379903 RepID=UPI0008D4C228|nr:tripartite tricarboxylate transporter substrate binding protein [Roseivivax marinus]SEL63195.1 Tripartite-type tricarboxylate transporter, receptor component TctC [Roseivivax marinus]
MPRHTLMTGAVAALMTTAAAAEMPDGPIEVIVGYSAGGGTDVMARTVANHLEEELGDGLSVVVKNMPGAGGQIGFTEVAQAQADGSTLGTFNLPAALALTLDRDASYDADSYTYLANFVQDPNTIVVPRDAGYESLDDLLDAAREAPGALPMALSSLGGNDHFSAILMQEAADVEFTMVPFKGASMARSALMGGHVAVGTMTLGQTVGFEENLKVLAVLDDERSEVAPDVPTAQELGYDVQMGSFRGLVAPADLPEDVRTSLGDALTALSEDKALLTELREQGSPVNIVLGDDYRALAEEQAEIAARIWEETPWK